MTRQHNAIDQSGCLATRLIAHGENRPDHAAVIFVTEQGIVSRLTYARLIELALEIAAGLLRRGLVGKPVGLLYPAGAEFVCAFLGCAFANAIAVPLAPIGRRKSRAENISRTLLDCQASLTIAETTWTQNNNSIVADLQNMGHTLLSTDDLRLPDQKPDIMPVQDGKEAAVLQYTSGSTGQPKGVIISHGAMMANQRMIERTFAHDSHSDFVGWAPHYHDQGLFGNIVQPLYLGSTCVLMAPTSFLRNPLFWLKTISEFGAKTSGGPNFAFDLCAAALTHADHSFEVDLSSWCNAFNGAEPIRAASLKRFADAFERYGFQADAFLPCFGMAECTLLASGIRKQPVVQLIRHFDTAALGQGKALETDETSTAARALVSCGMQVAGSDIRICAPSDPAQVLPAGQVGEILIAGTHLCDGYWRDTADAECFVILPGSNTRFFRSGDLGFMHKGMLYVTGRRKDLIIKLGRNIYPSDVEECARGVDQNLSELGIAAFGYTASGAENLGLAIETTRRGRKHLNPVSARKNIRQAINATLSLSPDRIVFVKPGGLPLTTSGKMKRAQVRELFELNILDTILEEER